MVLGEGEDTGMVDFCMVTPGGGFCGGPEGPVPAPVTLINFPAVIALVPPK